MGQNLTLGKCQVAVGQKYPTLSPKDSEANFNNDLKNGIVKEEYPNAFEKFFGKKDSYVIDMNKFKASYGHEPTLGETKCRYGIKNNVLGHSNRIGIGTVTKSTNLDDYTLHETALNGFQSNTKLDVPKDGFIWKK